MSFHDDFIGWQDSNSINFLVFDAQTVQYFALAETLITSAVAAPGLPVLPRPRNAAARPHAAHKPKP